MRSFAGPLAEPTLAEGLPASGLLSSQHGDSGNLGQPAQALPTHVEVEGIVYSASMGLMLAVSKRSQSRLMDVPLR